MPLAVLLFRILKFFNNCLYLDSNSVLPNLIAQHAAERGKRRRYKVKEEEEKG